MAVLVTGGCGFIGSHYVLRRMQKEGEEVVVNVDALTYAADPKHVASVSGQPRYVFVEQDVADLEKVDSLVAEYAPEAIVHFAAESHVDRSIDSAEAFIRTNVQGTHALLEAARRHDVPAFVQVGTDEVYGSRQEGASTEADALAPGNPYSASKAAGDLLALAYHNTYGLPVAVTRCTNNYGPHQHAEKLLPKVVSLALRDRPIPLYGDGSNVRDWLYVEDHCSAIDAVLGARAWGQVFNIAGQNHASNLDLVKRVLGLLDKSEDLIEFVKDRPGHDFRYALDDSKIRGLGWAPSVTFEDGLQRTIAWVRSQA